MDAAMRFLVLSLPRSRSAWLARFLSYKGNVCAHDLAPRATSVQDLAKAFDRVNGSVETGLSEAWPRLVERFPGLRIVTIHRPLIEICKSLIRVGAPVHLADLARKQYYLEQVPGLKIDFDSLNNPEVCRTIFEQCLEVPFDFNWWEALAPVNIQIDMAERLQLLYENRANIASMKAEAQPAREVGWPASIAAEPFASVAEALSLAEEHFYEIELPSPKRFKLDLDSLTAAWMSGNLLIYVARDNGRMVGYITWKLSFDAECYGNLQAEQGAWFADQDNPGIGTKLFDYSMQRLKEHGVKYILAHHRMQGRGAGLGPFFERRGMVETQRTYYKWIADNG